MQTNIRGQNKKFFCPGPRKTLGRSRSCTSIVSSLTAIDRRSRFVRCVPTGTVTCWRIGTKSRSSARPTDAASRTATPGRCAGTRRTITITITTTITNTTITINSNNNKTITTTITITCTTTTSRRPTRARRPRRRRRPPVPVAYSMRPRPCRRRRPLRPTSPPPPRPLLSPPRSQRPRTRHPVNCRNYSAPNRCPAPPPLPPPPSSTPPR